MVRLYNPGDFKEISLWYELRKLTPMDERLLPKIGAVFDGVAAGFLYQTDSTMCLLEGFVTNPEEDFEMRQRAVKEIAEYLFKVAESLRFKRIIAIANNESIINHCKHFGFDSLHSFSVYSKEI